MTDAWKAYIRRYKTARTFLLRSIKGVDRLIANESFTLWKTVYFTARREVYHENIAELQRRKRGHEQHIGELNRQIQINDSTQHHVESKLQSQSQKILANFIARFIHAAQARGFYTWLDELKEFKTRRRHLRSTVAYWIKQNSGRAFRTWAETVLAIKERELQQEQAAREAERRELQRVKDEEDAAQCREVEALSAQLNQATAMKDQLRANYEKALETHVQRVHNNVYVDKRRNIFCIWADYVKKERNAVNLIGAIARRNLRMEVFSRIRLVARERFLEANAERVCSSLFTLLKSRVLSRAFNKWRVRSYSEAVGTMTAKREELVLTTQRH